MKRWSLNWIFYVFIQVVILGALIIFAVFGDYDKSAGFSEKNKNTNNTANNSSNTITKPHPIDAQYPLFQDVHVMVFVGFGFLMTFLKRYGYSAVGFSFFLSCLVILWNIFLEGLLHLENKRFNIAISNLINADVAAASFLISFGAILGKVNPNQLVFFTILQSSAYVANKYVIEEVFKAVDVGGSLIVHAFGAFFGLSVSLVLGYRSKTGSEKHELDGSSYQSNINAMIGTLFLWVFWPSFNAALASDNEKHRIIINTYLSLIMSCLVAFVNQVEISKSEKFGMVYIQNATLAGGVLIGAVCNVNIRPFGAMLIGLFAGLEALYSYRFFQDCLHKILMVHDTCGVLSLHGLPGIFGGVIAAALAFFADVINDDRGYEIYHAMAATGLHRSAAVQGGYQIAAIGVTLALSVAGGLLTGAFISMVFPVVPFDDYFKDDMWWDDVSAD